MTAAELRALDQIEKAYDSRDSVLIALPTFDWFDPLRDETRFQDVVRRMEFPPWAQWRTTNNA